MSATFPISGVMFTVAALRASHWSVVEPPRSIVAGWARNVTVGAGGGGGVGAGGGGGGGVTTAVFL